MNKIIYIALAIVLLIIFIPKNKNVIINEPPVPVIEQPSNELVTGNTADIKVGQTKTINGLSIKFNSIVSDNRCPKDVNCIEAGAVTANVTYSVGTETKTLNMPSDEVPQQFSGYEISIIDINPPLYSTVTIDKNSYVLTFKVDRK